jgi:hypothetical protein
MNEGLPSVSVSPARYNKRLPKNPVYPFNPKELSNLPILTQGRQIPTSPAKNLLLPHTKKISTIPQRLYVLPIAAAMNHRLFLVLTIILGLFLTSLGTGQELVSIPTEEAVGNPYPGLGNVSPSTISPLSSAPSTITLYAEDTNYSELVPTLKSTELYLSRFPSKERTGMFQKVNFNALWVPTNGSRGLGMTELDLSAMFALPLPTPDSPLLITPKFATTFFDTKGWNETFHTTGVNLRWIRPIAKNKLTADLGFGIFYSGDFKVRTGDAVRYPAHLAGIWNFNPRTKMILGVVYSDRRDSYNFFPMAGLIWTPNDDVSVELIVPRMRVAQRIRWFGSAAGDESSDWIYTAFEFGGGSWGYEPYKDYHGRFEYRDLRLLLGYERRTSFGLTLGLEIGYMFDRNVEIGGHDKHPSDTVFLRLRSSF